MHRLTAALMGALFAAAVVLVILYAGAGAGGEPALTSLDGSAPNPDGGAPSDSPLGLDSVDIDAGFELDLDDEPVADYEGIDAGGTLLPNGEAPPPLSADAPSRVVFGVVLVQYRGAQGAPKDARTHDEARALADELAKVAREDFEAAVARGDRGSDENMGSMPRGMLEPAPEYVLFSLEKGGVSEPVDTPRGFWIIKRIE